MTVRELRERLDELEAAGEINVDTPMAKVGYRGTLSRLVPRLAFFNPDHQHTQACRYAHQPDGWEPVVVL